MMDSLLQIGLSNACFAFLLAVLAWIVGRKSKRPYLAHLLWLLVLIKLVTPPIFNFPIGDFAAADEVETVEVSASNDFIGGVDWDMNDVVSSQPTTSAISLSKVSAVWVVIKPWLGLVWLVGSLILVAWSLVRVRRFHRLLRQNSRVAGGHVMNVAQRVGRQLGLKNLPIVSITTARLCPMVWWVGGRVHVIMPCSMFEEMKQDQWKLVLAHELAHVCRRDYLVRWLEWLACACFWWNPVVWVAQRNLRAAEEICCDELVLSSLKPDSRSYAESILLAVESLVCPVIRPPAMASEINSGGVLERRVEMILSGSKINQSILMRLCVGSFALLFIPLGIVGAQDFDAIKKRLTSAVKQDEISFAQAASMMEALRDSVHYDESEAEATSNLEKRTSKLRKIEFQNSQLDSDERRVLDFLTEGQGSEHGKRSLADRASEKEQKERPLELEQKTRAIQLQALEARLAESLARKKGINQIPPKVELEVRGQKTDPRMIRFQAAETEIKQMIEAGKLDKAEGQKRLEEIKKKLWWNAPKRNAKSDKLEMTLRQAELEFSYMVKAGELTKEQARERFLRIKKKLLEEKKLSEKKTDDHRRPDVSNTNFFLDALRAAEANEIDQRLKESEAKNRELAEAAKWARVQTQEPLAVLNEKTFPENSAAARAREYLNRYSFELERKLSYEESRLKEALHRLAEQEALVDRLKVDNKNLIGDVAASRKKVVDLTNKLFESKGEVDSIKDPFEGAYYLSDDIQYFPKGPEFKLSREAAALKKSRSDAAKAKEMTGEETNRLLEEYRIRERDGGGIKERDW